VASAGKLCQRGAVGYRDGEREEKGIAVVTPSLVAGIITDSTAEKFTVPELKEVDMLQKAKGVSGTTARESG
jgi:hypothetical protein